MNQVLLAAATLLATIVITGQRRERLSAENPAAAQRKVVLLDNYFNNETRKDKDGNVEHFHYLWNDTAISGFSIWGQAFTAAGAELKQLETAPDAAALANASVYIIVDPDNLKDNPQPNYMSGQPAAAIATWVKKGGTLVLMANDSANCDLQHFNILSEKFGISFTSKSRNMVKGHDLATGEVVMPAGNGIFTETRKAYLKEISVLAVKAPATALVTADNGDVEIATATYGKGVVFAVGDPWLYNEYTDGKRLPAEYQNTIAARELAQWLLQK